MRRPGAWIARRWWYQDKLDLQAQGWLWPRNQTGDGGLKGELSSGRSRKEGTEDMGYTVAHEKH